MDPQVSPEEGRARTPGFGPWFHHPPSYMSTPPTQVRSTSRSRRSSGGRLRMSPEITMKSARNPGAIFP